MDDHSAPFGRRFVGPGFAVGAALLFGVSTPFAKEIGQNVNPWLLAGLLYLGSGIGLAAWRLARGAAGVRNNEAALKRSDLRWLAAIVFFGGVAAPLFLMFGLQATPGSTASLLLNLEGLATMAIAWIVYRESVDRRLLVGAFAILAGAVVLSWDFSTIALSSGALLIAIACFCWGIDNNLTRKLSAADPVQIAMIKGLAAGATNVILGFATGAELPAPSAVLFAGVVGVFGYGISLVLFVLALRELGAAHRRLLLHRTVYRRADRRRRLRRTGDVRAGHRRDPYGRGRVAAPERKPRTLARARADDARTRPRTRRASSARPRPRRPSRCAAYARPQASAVTAQAPAFS